MAAKTGWIEKRRQGWVVKTLKVDCLGGVEAIEKRHDVEKLKEKMKYGSNIEGKGREILTAGLGLFAARSSAWKTGGIRHPAFAAFLTG